MRDLLSRHMAHSQISYIQNDIATYWLAGDTGGRERDMYFNSAFLRQSLRRLITRFRLEEAQAKMTSRGRENLEQLQDEVEAVTKINSSKSHEIKKNDIAISHMEKNMQGRQTFLTTIELDINRAESYAKRLQKEFEREFETVGLCNDILTVCNEDLSDDHDDTEKELNEETCDNDDLINLSDDPPDFLQSNFSVSATQNPFGALT